MKKYLVCLLSFLFLFYSYNELKRVEYEDLSVMSEIRTYNNIQNKYELIFDDEVLNLSNFKLKMANFSNNSSNIREIYLNYPNNLKDYFKDIKYISVTGNDLNEIIKIIKERYEEVLIKNNVYERGYTDNNISINKVILESNIQIVDKFKIKYPNVKIMTK